MNEKKIVINFFICDLVLGQPVSVDDQVDLKADIPAESPATSTISLAGNMVVSMNEGDRSQFQEERLKLYQQLDDKVNLFTLLFYPVLITNTTCLAVVLYVSFMKSKKFVFCKI